MWRTVGSDNYRIFLKGKCGLCLVFAVRLGLGPDTWIAGRLVSRGTLSFLGYFPMHPYTVAHSCWYVGISFRVLAQDFSELYLELGSEIFLFSLLVGLLPPNPFRHVKNWWNMMRCTVFSICKLKRIRTHLVHHPWESEVYTLRQNAVVYAGSSLYIRVRLRVWFLFFLEGKTSEGFKGWSLT